MGAETVATLVLVAVLVAALAVFLVAIGIALTKLSFTLGTIVIGLRAIAQQTTPVGPVVGDLIGDVDNIEDALDGVIAAVGAAKKAPKPVPAAATPVPAAGGNGRSRRSQARWPARDAGPSTRPARGRQTMGDAVARARDTVDSQPKG